MIQRAETMLWQFGVTDVTQESLNQLKLELKVPIQ